MTYDKARAGRLLPFDPRTITGVRIDGEPGVTAVDPGTAQAVVASGETWLLWELGGVHHAVNTGHIAELVAHAGARAVVDLTEPANDYSRLKALKGVR